MFNQGFSCLDLLFDTSTQQIFEYRAVTFFRSPSQVIPLTCRINFVSGLFRFRSPLLTESRLISFPLGTEMFHFPRFACRTFAQHDFNSSKPGFPIRTSTPHRLFDSSALLFAAFHVLLRLLPPRHPLRALLLLDFITLMGLFSCFRPLGRFVLYLYTQSFLSLIVLLKNFFEDLLALHTRIFLKRTVIDFHRSDPVNRTTLQLLVPFTPSDPFVHPFFVSALPGGAEEDRTPDLRIANATLSQLSYSPI